MKYLQKLGNWIIILAGGIALLISSHAAIPDGISTSLALQRIPPLDEIFFWIAAALGVFYIPFRRYLRKYKSCIIIFAVIAQLILSASIALLNNKASITIFFTIFFKTTLGLFAIDAGILGFCYIVGVLYLLFFNRIKFDQLLVSGDFLTKVTRLVLFFPFALTFFSLFVLNSPKDLTYYNESSKQSSEFYSNDKSTLEQQEPNMLWSTIYHFLDPGNQDMTIGKGRVWGALIAICGMVLLNGLLVSSIIGYFDKRKEQYAKGAMRYGGILKCHHHYVVIGGNDVAVGIIKQLLTGKEPEENNAAKPIRSLKELSKEYLYNKLTYIRALLQRGAEKKDSEGNNAATPISNLWELAKEYLYRKPPYILVQTSQDVEKFRQRLFSALTEEEKKRVIIYYGNRTSPEDIADLQLECARNVYLLGEETRTDDIESHHDTINMECMELILEAFKKTQRVQAVTRLTARIKEIQKLIKKEEELIKEEEKQNEVIKGHKNNIEILKKEKEEILEAFKKDQRRQTLTRLTARIKEIPELIKKEGELIKEEEKQNEVIKGHKNNIEILKEEKRAIEKAITANQLECRIMFEYQTTFSVFQFYDIENATSSYINFKPFNYYEMWAQKVLINKEINGQKIKDNASKGGYLPLEGADGIKQDSDDYVHLFIVGMSRMGIAMAVEAAHLAHYPNYVTKNIRTKITFIDKNAAEEKEFFMGRLKSLFDLSHWRYGKVYRRSKLVWEEKHEPIGYDYLGGDFLDIEWEFVNGGIEVPAVQDYIQYSATPQAKITIAICLPESSRAHAAAMYLSRGIYESTAVQQILVYNRYGNAIIDAITKSGNIHPYCGKFKSFGHAAGCYVEQNIIDSEKIGKEINAAYEKINISDEDKQKKEKVNYKGKSSVANTWSSIYNGNTLWTKLRSIDYDGTGLNDSDIMVLADVEHNRWNTEELIMNFVPLTIEEQQNAKQLNNFNKDKLKGEMKHLDICSNRKLMEIDREARIYDVELTRLLHNIYQELNTKKE